MPKTNRQGLFIGCYVTEEIKQAMSAIATLDDRTESGAVRMALRKYIEEKFQSDPKIRKALRKVYPIIPTVKMK